MYMSYVLLSVAQFVIACIRTEHEGVTAARLYGVATFKVCPANVPNITYKLILCE